MTEIDINAMALDLAVQACAGSCGPRMVLDIAAAFRAFILKGA